MKNVIVCQETDAKRAKRSSVAATRKSTDAAKSTDSTMLTSGSANSGAATPLSPLKPEIISRSGRKIKPKKFLDEEEGAGGPLEANGTYIYRLCYHLQKFNYVMEKIFFKCCLVLVYV